MLEHCLEAMSRRYALQTHELMNLPNARNLSSNDYWRWTRLCAKRFLYDSLPAIWYSKYITRATSTTLTNSLRNPVDASGSVFAPIPWDIIHRDILISH
jgi:hypothetical protein